MLLKSNQIEAARLFTNKNEHRPLCSHSFIINGKLVSTDGHAMLVQQLRDCNVNFKKIDINGDVGAYLHNNYDKDRHPYGLLARDGEHHGTLYHEYWANEIFNRFKEI